MPEELVLAAIVRATNPFYYYATYEEPYLVEQAPRATRQLQRLSRRKVLQLEGQAQGRWVQPVLGGDDEARDSNAIGGELRGARGGRRSRAGARSHSLPWMAA